MIDGVRVGFEHSVPCERHADAAAALEAQCWREGGGIQLQQAGWVSGRRDRGRFGGRYAVSLRQRWAAVMPLLPGL